MEKIGGPWEEGKLKSHTAIRCAKTAFLLSSLKNATKNSNTNIPQLQEEEKIEKLRIELVKEKQKLKKLRHWIGLLLISYLLVVLICPFILSYL